MLKRFVVLTSSMAALALAGCPSETPDPPASADWGFVSAVLANNCSPCHTGSPGYPAADPMMVLGDADQAYDVLVGHPAAEAPALSRIEPGDPDNSYLLRKLEGTHEEVGGSGARMPENGPYLSDETIAAIREWVAAGASEVVTGDDDDSVADDDDSVADDDDTGDDDDSAILAPTFSNVYTTVISERCSCHSGDSHSTGFAFSGSQATAYAVLVGVPSFELPAMDRIEPADLDNSYLIHKITGTAGGVGGVDTQMPLSGGPLTEEQRTLIRDWVSAGALND